MRVSLASHPESSARRQAAQAGEMLLAPSGPSVVLGSAPSPDGLAQPIVPGARTLFGPRGAALNPATGALAVADTGHHRLMLWRQRPTADYTAADVQIGQPDFTSEGRNGKGPVGAATLNVPTGVATDGLALAIADAWNHRVLVWRTWPGETNQPADVVLGQRDFSGAEPNRGGAVSAATLNWCYGVAFIGGMLAVADTGNRRVLIWRRLPEENGQPADVVLGQRSFECRDENAGEGAGALGMRWPHAIAAHDGMLLVSDAGNRIMAWRRLPGEPGAPCDLVLGQPGFAHIEHNRSRYLPDAHALNMPYGLTTAGPWLIAADTANSRLVGWRADSTSGALAMDAPATGLAGQPHFNAKGDNRWQAPVRDSLCWPYGVTASGGTVVVADSGNNRVGLWELASCS
jgi:hypothetical protein